MDNNARMSIDSGGTDTLELMMLQDAVIGVLVKKGVLSYSELINEVNSRSIRAELRLLSKIED
jgi:hypothetical protein